MTEDGGRKAEGEVQGAGNGDGGAPIVRRPLLWLSVSFMIGIGSQRLPREFSPGSESFAVAVSLLILASLLALKIPARLGGYFARFFINVLLFLAMGMWAGFLAAPELPHPKRIEPFLDRQLVSYIAEVSAPPDYYPDKVKIPLCLIAALVDGRQVPVSAGALLTVDRKNSAAAPSFRLPGERLIVRMTLKPFRNFKNPGAFDYARYQAEKGFHASAYLKDDALMAPLAPENGLSPIAAAISARGRIDLFRQKALFWLRANQSAESAAFYAALILGYQNFLDRNWQDHIQRTGLNHLLTVSGFHLGLVSLLVFWLVRLLVRGICPGILSRVSDSRIAVWPALGCAVVYAFLAGFGVPPIWRSVLMLAVCFGAAFWHRSPDSLTVLALAALVILALDPNSLWQISFQLTFACVLAIITIYPRLRRNPLSRLIPGRAPRWIVSQLEDVFFGSIAVSILVLPLTIFYFNGFSLAAFAANVVLVPYVGFVILPWGLISLAVFAVNESLAWPFARIGEWLLALCLRLVEWFSNFSWSYFWTGSMSLFSLFSIYAALALMFAPLSKKARFAGLAALALLIGGNSALDLAEGRFSGQYLRADMIDVGQGASTLVRFPTGEAMLVDGGGFRDDSYDMGRAVTAPFLWRAGVRKLDHIVLSHDHPDHRNGLRFILANFDAGSFWTSRIDDRPAKKGSPQAPSGLEEIALRRGIRVRSFPDLFDDLRIGDATVSVRHPGRRHIENRGALSLNDMSLVLEIRYGETTLVLPGDIGAAIEAEVVRDLEKDRRALLVSPHHGSDHSNSAELLDALRPFAIVFSCGYGNQFGFPAPGALRRCEDRSIRIYRTDLDGAVHAASDGRQWTITTEADQANHAKLFSGRPSR